MVVGGGVVGNGVGIVGAVGGVGYAVVGSWVGIAVVSSDAVVVGLCGLIFYH